MKRLHPTARELLLVSVIICLVSSSLFIYFPLVFGEPDEWLEIENEFFIVIYHTGSETDARDTLSAAMWVRDTTMEKYPHTLDIKVTITIYNDREEILLKEGVPTALAIVGSTPEGSIIERIGILIPSWTGHWGGYETLDNPFRRILNHEYIHCPFYTDLYSKSQGYSDPPGWFSQGIAEYISANYLPSYENTVRESVKQGIFTINEPYSWGLYIVEYMYAEYGQDKVVGIIRSSESTFYDALEQELGVTYLEFEDGWKRYLSNKFGVEYELYSLTQLEPEPEPEPELEPGSLTVIVEEPEPEPEPDPLEELREELILAFNILDNVVAELIVGADDMDSRMDVLETNSNETNERITQLENEISRLENTILYAFIATAVILTTCIAFFMKKANA